MHVAISAAHAMEFYTFRRYMGKVKKLPLESWQHYLWQHNGNEIILLETGIGPVEAEGALQALIRHYQVDCIINFGSAGMIDENLKIGDAFLADEVVYVTSGEMLTTNSQMTEAISQFFKIQQKSFNRGRLITSPDPVVKRAHRKKLAANFSCGAVDMEAYALAKVANDNKIPFAALKMISDRANALTRLEFWKNLPLVDRTLGKLMYGFLDYLNAA